MSFSAVSTVYSQKKEVAVDPAAKSLLDKASAKFNTSTGLTAKLSVKVDNEQNGKNQTYPATLLLKSSKFKLSLANVDTYYDGKTEYVHLIKEKEVNISEPDPEDLKDINPIMLMQSYKTGYKMKHMGNAKVNGKLVENVDLYPNDRTKTFSIITISVDKETLMPVQIKAKGKNGINTIVNVDSYTRTKLSDSQFVFDTKLNKGVEVIDLR